MVKRWFSLIFLFEFGRIFEVMFSCLWILWNILSFQDLASLCLSEEKSNRSFPPKKKKRPMLELPPYPLRVTTRKNSILIGSGIILTKPGTCDLGSWVGGGWGLRLGMTWEEKVPKHCQGPGRQKATKHGQEKEQHGLHEFCAVKKIAGKDKDPLEKWLIPEKHVQKSYEKWFLIKW